MNAIYSLWPHGEFCSLVIDESDVEFVVANINRKGGAKRERPIHASLIKSAEGGTMVPDVAVPNAGGLAIRGECADRFLKGLAADIDILPLQVDGEGWFLVSCLSSVDHIDEGKSSLMRSLSGEIFMVLRLFIASSMVPEVFVLEGSNRAQIFATDDFRVRVMSAGLKGISFDEIGSASI